MFGDPWWYTRCFVMLLMKPGELCGKQVLKVRQQLILWTTHFSDNYPSFTSRDSSILQEQSTIQRFAGDYPGGRRNQVIAGIRLFPRRMSPPNYLETGKIVVGCKKKHLGCIESTGEIHVERSGWQLHQRRSWCTEGMSLTHDSWNHKYSLILVQIFKITENSMDLWTA